jgi:hypothetical protein
MRAAVYFVKTSLFITCLMALTLSLGCKPKLLPSSNVKATRENKEIIEFLEQYKAAVEKRSVEALMELVAKDYSDNMGTEDPAQHTNYLTLKERLEKTLPRIEDSRLGLFVQHIKKLENGLYEVVFYFNNQVLMNVPAGEKWLSVKEVSRMVLRKRTDKKSPYKFEILSGV